MMPLVQLLFVDLSLTTKGDRPMSHSGHNLHRNRTWIGLALTVAGIAFSMIGDGLNDLLRPRS